jgi:hypothetical protein
VLLAVVALLGVAVASLVLPTGVASAQSALSIDNFRPRCATVGSGTDVAVSGRTGFGTVSAVLYAPSGGAVTKTSTSASGSYSLGFAFTPRETGSYEVRVSDSSGTLSAYIEVPCQAPTIEFSPTCFPVGYSGTVTLTGRHFLPYGTGYADYDVNGSEAQSQIRIPVDARGVFSATFKVTPSNRPHPSELADANRTLVASGSWNPCPPGTIPPTTTSTSSTTTTSTPGDTVPDTVPDPATTTTTSSPDPGLPFIPTTTIPLPPTVEIPPPTPGASLVLSPRIGPPGFVTMARGAGFPAGAVTLDWSGGVGRTTTTAGADGTFSVQVLILPRDRLGPRALVATGQAGVTAYDGFLVVPASVQPSSGREVAQITRIRRFTQR